MVKKEKIETKKSFVSVLVFLKIDLIFIITFGAAKFSYQQCFLFLSEMSIREIFSGLSDMYYSTFRVLYL